MLLSAFLQSKLYEFFSYLDEDFQISEFLQFIRDVLFDVKIGQYRHFSLGNAAPETIQNAVLCVTVAVILASFWLSHVRSKQGKFVRALLDAGAKDPKSAKTLYDTGFFRDREIRRSLSAGNELHIAVKCVEAEMFCAEKRRSEMEAEAGQGIPSDRSAEEPIEEKRSFLEKICFWKPAKKEDGFCMDFTKAHFYIPEEAKYLAENRFSVQGFGTTKLILVSVATVFLAVIFCRILNPILSLADALLTLLE